ncbi:hypothetical protein BaRGS_00028573 [Batillaria attramentaria]|uniref:Uncharacterized protein n=1 Tax=Batillaria attramentaria TaxID=370345 RepID=A0ABD0JZF2_9CAEN
MEGKCNETVTGNNGGLNLEEAQQLIRKTVREPTESADDQETKIPEDNLEQGKEYEENLRGREKDSLEKVKKPEKDSNQDNGYPDKNHFSEQSEHEKQIKAPVEHEDPSEPEGEGESTKDNQETTTVLKPAQEPCEHDNHCQENDEKQTKEFYPHRPKENEDTYRSRADAECKMAPKESVEEPCEHVEECQRCDDEETANTHQEINVPPPHSKDNTEGHHLVEDTDLGHSGNDPPFEADTLPAKGYLREEEHCSTSCASDRNLTTDNVVKGITTEEVTENLKVQKETDVLDSSGHSVVVACTEPGVGSANSVRIPAEHAEPPDEQANGVATDNCECTAQTDAHSATPGEITCSEESLTSSSEAGSTKKGPSKRLRRRKRRKRRKRPVSAKQGFHDESSPESTYSSGLSSSEEETFLRPNNCEHPPAAWRNPVQHDESPLINTSHLSGQLDTEDEERDSPQLTGQGGQDCHSFIVVSESITEPSAPTGSDHCAALEKPVQDDTGHISYSQTRRTDTVSTGNNEKEKPKCTSVRNEETPESTEDRSKHCHRQQDSQQIDRGRHQLNPPNAESHSRTSPPVCQHAVPVSECRRPVPERSLPGAQCDERDLLRSAGPAPEESLHNEHDHSIRQNRRSSRTGIRNRSQQDLEVLDVPRPFHEVFGRPNQPQGEPPPHPPDCRISDTLRLRRSRGFTERVLQAEPSTHVPVAHSSNDESVVDLRHGAVTLHNAEDAPRLRGNTN